MLSIQKLCDNDFFELQGHDEAQRIRGLLGKFFKVCNIVGIKKYDGRGFMVWGCKSYEGMNRLVFIDKAIFSIAYMRILSENLRKACMLICIIHDWYFSKTMHIAKNQSSMWFFIFKARKLLYLSYKSQYINFIMHAGSFMKKFWLKWS